MKTLLVIIALLALVGCDEPQVERMPPPPKPAVVRVEVSFSNRFDVVHYGTFHAGYQGNLREVLVIHDQMTGADYLGITGVGVSELRDVTHHRTVGKTSYTTHETVEE